MKLDYEYMPSQLLVQQHIQECEGKHTQQVAYSSYHNALTQICFDCKKVRSNNLELGIKKKKKWF